jgi:energy-coupling factor transport system permease protein
VRRSRYRPDPWRAPEWIVAGSGVLAAVVLWISARRDIAGVYPAFSPLHWPTLPLLPVLALLAAAIGGLAAPPPASRGASRLGDPRGARTAAS